MSQKRKSTRRSPKPAGRSPQSGPQKQDQNAAAWAEVRRKLEQIDASKRAQPALSSKPRAAAARGQKSSRPPQAPFRIHVDPESVRPLSTLERAVDGLDPQSVAVTYWLDTAGWAGSRRVTVRFRGLLSDADANESNTFVRDEVVEDIEPDTGRIAVTLRHKVAQRGIWRVRATPVMDGVEQPERSQLSDVRTRYHLIAFGPGVNVLSWPLLVGLGALFALVLQVLFLAAGGWPWWQPFLIASIGILVGIVGARLWALALHRKPLRQFMSAGACIQGFIVGAVLVMLLGSLVFQIPLGVYFDLSAPGIFLGLAVGRPGCFLTGCCYGRPSAAKWALWSSDRREGRRRYPVQLVEAAMALFITILAFVAVLAFDTAGTGAVFVIGMLLYIIGRQFLFPLRKESRTARGRLLTILVSVAGILLTVGYAVLPNLA
ncbi:prolipoprotein diacylglyceryl transferase [Crystallibacter degradans]|uniref:prolipoprotein diacylglyceryl transferase n=1 Tax=Crystallibacter degradans TaxID=2726743 RepID=UPI0014744CB6|nr:prolipoprotein diacylglyceryl transferase family protein [Arthrobacter sp. SF27]NMR31200.1 prolipoprotein diacylglyceryl transferase [Arthrobacter sp. SF27]